MTNTEIIFSSLGITIGVVAYTYAVHFLGWKAGMQKGAEKGLKSSLSAAERMSELIKEAHYKAKLTPKQIDIFENCLRDEMEKTILSGMDKAISKITKNTYGRHNPK